MMVRALMAGGLRAVFSKDSEDVLEIGIAEQLRVGFPNSGFENHVIKMFGGYWGHIHAVCPGEYRAVWLHRPPEERWRSYHKQQEDEDLEIWSEGDPIAGQVFQNVRDAKSLESLGIMKLRSDIDVVEMDYAALCEKPLEHFRKLQAAGWPIDPVGAAKIPDERNV